MSDNGNNFPEIPFGNRDDANGMASQALQQWAERYYAKMVEEKHEYSATGVPPIRKSGTAFPRKVYRLSAKVYRSFFRL